MKLKQPKDGPQWVRRRSHILIPLSVSSRSQPGDRLRSRNPNRIVNSEIIEAIGPSEAAQIKIRQL
ncbi:hypothetical protein [Oscillatoria sp. HE19RPO]|uniref:hypothetical protein n=1 Tax=Oscillatoria sp. HE19RPO TaxID=2954806 RepID=UPI0020C1D0D5|nr:hypothetical protein [Oscillatoria sp. HE19RPO]